MTINLSKHKKTSAATTAPTRRGKVTLKLRNQGITNAASAAKSPDSSKTIKNAETAHTESTIVLEKVAVAWLDGKAPMYEVMRIKTVTGALKLLALRRSLASSQKKVYEAALNAGAALPYNTVQAKAHVNRYIASAPSICNATIVTRGGWHEPGRAYVRNNFVIRGAFPSVGVGK